jgi:hypothetical protein
MAITPVPASRDVTQIQQDLDTAKTGLTTAQGEAKAKIDELNNLQLRDKDGKIIKCTTLEEWRDAFAKGGVKYASGNYVLGGPNDNNSVSNLVKRCLEKLTGAQDKVDSLSEQLSSMEAFKKLIDGGDIMGAIMLLCTTRAQNMDKLLTLRVNEMQSRNIQVKQLTDSLATLQGQTPRDEATITRLNGQIQALNNTSQTQMIEINDLVTKKNQAYDMMSNLMNKFYQSMGNVISNMR